MFGNGEQLLSIAMLAAGTIFVTGFVALATFAAFFQKH